MRQKNYTALFFATTLSNRIISLTNLVESLDAARRHRWEELTSKMNFTHSSRKSLALIRRLGVAQQPPKSTHPSVSANAVAAHLIQVAKAPHDKKFERQVRMQGRTLSAADVRQESSSSIH